MIRTLLITIAFAVAQSVTTAGSDRALLDVLVFGTHMPIDAGVYSGALKADVTAYLRRASAYKSPRPAPAPDGLLEMVHLARVSYERRLVAITTDSNATKLAVEYVNNLRPCYEWEGYHDCPEREAQFADKYQTEHATGPFSPFLPLLSAHRWLCASEAYKTEEKNAADSARTRRLYDQRLVVARRSTNLLVRTAAEQLARVGRCFPN